MKVIDTSDSMVLVLLEIIDAELKRLARDYQVMVVECDAVIHRQAFVSALTADLGVNLS